MSSITDDLRPLLHRKVVLDTRGSMVYLGVLTQTTETGFWLADADVHDCRDGHATKELYVLDAHRDGIRHNRTRVFVLRSVVASISELSDVVGD